MIEKMPEYYNGAGIYIGPSSQKTTFNSMLPTWPEITAYAEKHGLEHDDEYYNRSHWFWDKVSYGLGHIYDVTGKKFGSGYGSYFRENVSFKDRINFLKMTDAADYWEARRIYYAKLRAIAATTAFDDDYVQKVRDGVVRAQAKRLEQDKLDAGRRKELQRRKLRARQLSDPDYRTPDLTHSPEGVEFLDKKLPNTTIKFKATE
jgi:hypothetical protein